MNYERLTLKVNSYRELDVWQKSIELVTKAYKLTRTFPKSEAYILVNQLQRAAISVPANIAEGWGRQSRKEYIHFLRIARGSLSELETHLIISSNLNYVSPHTLESLLGTAQEIGKMLNSMIGRLTTKTNKP